MQSREIAGFIMAFLTPVTLDSLRRTGDFLRWRLLSVPIYIKVLGIGVIISLLFASVAFYQIRSRVFQAHYQMYGETALSVALSVSSLLESNKDFQTKEKSNKAIL
mgnify:CR=1 FL=1